MGPAYAPYAYNPYIINSLRMKNGSFWRTGTGVKVPAL